MSRHLRPLTPSIATLRAAHFAQGRYFNPWGVARLASSTSRGGSSFSRNPYDKSGPPRVPSAANDGGALARPAARPEVTWVGHATFAVHDGGDVFLTDPHFGPRALVPRAAPAAGRPARGDSGERVGVLSHNHYDHLDALDRRAAAARRCAWLVPLGLGDWFRAARPRGRRTSSTGGRARGRGFRITCLPAQHWSRRLAQTRTRRRSGAPGSSRRRSAAIFFAGDTGYFHGFAEYGRRFGPIDVAHAADRRLRAALVHEAGAHEPGRGVQAFRDLRRAPHVCDALGHLRPHRRADRRGRPGAGTPARRGVS